MSSGTPVNMPALFIGTRKGLFIARRNRAEWRLTGPRIAGYEVMHTFASAHRPGVIYASVRHPVWGAHLYQSWDAGDHWESLPETPKHPPGRFPTALKAIWGLAEDADGRLYAGIDPAGLFYSDDEARSWAPVTALNDHPTRDAWEPARGGFSVHSIQVHPADPAKLWVAVSAGGVFRSVDRGRSWVPCNRGIPARNLPAASPIAGHNVHKLLLHPRRPERLYRQCYHGTWRSDDGGDSWLDITAGLPGDFGYAIAIDPHDPDGVFEVPESDAHMRAVVDGKLRLFRSRDGGKSWSDASRGLPQRDAWVTVLREAIDSDDAQPCGVYFGTSSGHVFASPDAAESWQRVAEFLPRILSIRVLRDPA